MKKVFLILIVLFVLSLSFASCDAFFEENSEHATEKNTGIDYMITGDDVFEDPVDTESSDAEMTNITSEATNSADDTFIDRETEQESKEEIVSSDMDETDPDDLESGINEETSSDETESNNTEIESQSNDSETESSEVETGIVAVFDKFYDKNYKFGEDHSDGGEMKTASSKYTSGNFVLKFEEYENVYKNARDAKGNPALKLGKGSETAHFEFTVPDDISYVIIKVAKYKEADSIIIVNGIEYDLTKNSDDGEYDEIYINTEIIKTIVFDTSEITRRCMIRSIEYYR